MHLAQFSQLTAEELQQMKDFEEEERRKVKKQTKTINYYNKVRTMDKDKKIYRLLKKGVLWRDFKKAFFENEKKYFINDNVSVANVKPLFYYFLNNLDQFKDCDNTSNITTVDLSKGLLIVGDYGCGKTATMKALEKATKGSKFGFKYYTAKEIVTRYNACENPLQKSELINEVCTGTRYFDDILSEHDANNYGKVNLFRDIFEMRYAKEKRTFITINYHEDHPGDMKKAIEQLGERYGKRVYDRLFEMFNVIEFKGNSRR